MGFLYICKSAKEDGVFSNIFKKKVPNFYPMLEVQVTNINEKKIFSWYLSELFAHFQQ